MELFTDNICILDPILDLFYYAPLEELSICLINNKF